MQEEGKTGPSLGKISLSGFEGGTFKFGDQSSFPGLKRWKFITRGIS